jgi:hypothetical protein
MASFMPTDPLDYMILPSYLNSFEACLIPFKFLPVIAATDPVKFYEYLAVGKPVIAPDMPEFRGYDDLAHLYNSIAVLDHSFSAGSNHT